MLSFQPLEEHRAPPERMVELLEQFRDLLQKEGMASMEEYGDMLKWALPSAGGPCRYFHVFHPGFCSFSDAFFGTIHFHGGEIRGTVLLGHLEHDTYQAAKAPDGERFHEGDAYRLTKHTRSQTEGTSYSLPAMVPHWLRPTTLSLTYFEEDDNGIMGDLVNPKSTEPDNHVWTQEQADALVPDLLAMLDERLSRLLVAA